MKPSLLLPHAGVWRVESKRVRLAVAGSKDATVTNSEGWMEEVLPYPLEFVGHSRGPGLGLQHAILEIRRFLFDVWEPTRAFPQPVKMPLGDRPPSKPSP